MKTFFSVLIRLIITALILVVLFLKINFTQVFSTIKSCNLSLFTIAFLLFICLYFLGLWRWQMLLFSLKLHPPFKKIISAFSGGLFFNLFLPSTIGGDVARIYSLLSHTGEGGKVAATVIVDRLSGFLALTFISILSIIVGGRLIQSKSVIIIVVAIALTFTIITLLMFSRRTSKAFSSVFKFFHLERIENIWKRIFDALSLFRGNKMLLFKNFLISLIIQGSNVLAIYLIALSLGVKTGLIYFFIIVPIIAVISTLPITIGGLGLRDASSVLFFSKIGISSNIAFSISLISFFFVTFVGIAGGIIYAFSLHSRRLR
ncbi:MAG: lysylphosphatidylglycerol synthase transmembrane domain-containing protein [Candidatus Omnitrophota bacterium]